MQFWASALVVLPVFIQAPWVRLYPLSACLFTSVILLSGICLVHFGKEKWEITGSLLVGVSGSWLGGCLFWGWLRAQPVWHLPVESIALPFAIWGLRTRWRTGAAFYLSCLLGTAFTDLLMLPTGVMSKWPQIVQASIQEAPLLLQDTAEILLHTKPLLSICLAAGVIAIIARTMLKRAKINTATKSAWIVASAALFTTLWIDGLFLVTALIQPHLSGLI